jgi:hypothetical protein
MQGDFMVSEVAGCGPHFSRFTYEEGTMQCGESRRAFPRELDQPRFPSLDSGGAPLCAEIPTPSTAKYLAFASTPLLLLNLLSFFNRLNSLAYCT